VGHRILIVDDDAYVRSALTRLLGLRYPVDSAENGERALAIVCAHHTVVLCDLSMPGMSGLEFARRLEECQPVLARRIIFMTGGMVDAKTLAARSHHPLLEKPFGLEGFEAALARLDGC
jgi:CheY-like chemotaxis protein